MAKRRKRSNNSGCLYSILVLAGYLIFAPFYIVYILCVFIVNLIRSVTKSSKKTSIKRYQQIISTQNIDFMEGHAFEYWCAELLKKNGFTDVRVTSGSNDHGVDIIARKDGLKYAIQCKRYSHRLGNTPVQEVYTGKAVYSCDVAVVMTNNYFTKGAVTAANATGVLLWDRAILYQMQSNAGVYPRQRYGFRIAVIAGVLGLSLLIIIGLLSPNKTDDKNTTVEKTSASVQPSPSQRPEYVVSEDWRKAYIDYGVFIIDVHANVMEEYGQYYVGYVADTVVSIVDTTENTIYAQTIDNSNEKKAVFVFSFDDSVELQGLQADDIVEIMGTISGGNPLALENSHIISFGDTAVKRAVELEDSADTQIAYAEAYINSLN